MVLPGQVVPVSAQKLLFGGGIEIASDPVVLRERFDRSCLPEADQGVEMRQGAFAAYWRVCGKPFGEGSMCVFFADRLFCDTAKLALARPGRVRGDEGCDVSETRSRFGALKAQPFGVFGQQRVVNASGIEVSCGRVIAFGRRDQITGGGIGWSRMVGPGGCCRTPDQHTGQHNARNGSKSFLHDQAESPMAIVGPGCCVDQPSLGNTAEMQGCTLFVPGRAGIVRANIRRHRIGGQEDLDVQGIYDRSDHPVSRREGR